MSKLKISLLFLFLLVFNFNFLCLLEAQEVIPDSVSKISGVSLNENFSGVWEGKKVSLKKHSECVLCTQVVIECGPNEKLMPQTCEECAHCVNVSSGGFKKLIKQTNNKKTAEKTIKLMLCVKNGKIEGVVSQDDVINNAEIRSQSLIFTNKVFVVLLDKKGKTTSLVLELVDEKKLLVKISDDNSFEAIKTSPYKKCTGT